MRKKKKQKAIGKRSFEKKLRYPLAMVIFLLYILSIAFFKEEEVFLPQESTPLIIYSNQTGDDLEKTVREAILQAKESISLMIYTLTDQSIMNALRKKSEEGVKVNLVVDSEATHDIGWIVGPKIKVIRRHKSGIMHNKLLVIDKKQVYYGSTNFTKDSFFTYANLIIGIDSQDLAAQAEKKIEAMQEDLHYQAKTVMISGKEQSIEFCFLPDAHHAQDKLVSLIDTAKKCVKVAMYTFTSQPLSQALANAEKRGVKVEVVMDRDSAKQTSASIYHKLKRLKVPTSISDRKGLLHHKLCIIDDDFLVTGSANWTKAAFKSNDENISFIHPLTDQQKEKLEKLWAVIVQESKSNFLQLSHK